MQSIRQIVDVKGNLLHLVLPSDFKADKVEVIVLPIVEQKVQNKPTNSERFSGGITKKTAEKIHQHLHETRDEWVKIPMT